MARSIPGVRAVFQRHKEAVVAVSEHADPMDEKPRVFSLSAREADRQLAPAIDRVRSGEARAIVLTRHGFGVGLIVGMRDAPSEVQRLLEQNPTTTWPSVGRRSAGAKR